MAGRPSHQQIMIRRYRRDDWAAVWAVLEPVFRAGDTYAYPRDITEEDARRTWTGSPKVVFVAEIAFAAGRQSALASVCPPEHNAATRGMR